MQEEKISVGAVEFLGNLVEIFRAGKPVRFYPYTSSVQERIVKGEFEDSGAVYNLAMMSCVRLFNEAGVKSKHEHTDREYDVQPDNKVVFEFLLYEGNPGEIKLFIGFYDNIMSVGKSVRSEHLAEAKS